MGGQQDRLTLAPQLQQQCPDVFNALFVQAVQRFVQNQQSWVFHDSLGDPQPLAHSHGVFGHPLILCISQPELFHTGIHTFSGGPAVDSSQKLQVFQPAVIGHEAWRLNQQPQVRWKVHIPAHLVSCHNDPPSGGTDKTADALHQHGLPTAVASNDTVDLPLLKRNGNIPQDLGRPNGQADIFY